MVGVRMTCPVYNPRTLALTLAQPARVSKPLPPNQVFPSVKSLQNGWFIAWRERLRRRWEDYGKMEGRDWG